jgi:hypothetical protein
MATALAGWHDLYVTVGAAAATLVGLLFVGLSLHIRIVVAHPEVRSLARATLSDFFVVLLIAITLLQPTDSAAQVAYWLAGIGIVSLVLMVRPLTDALTGGGARALGIASVTARFGVSILALAGLLVCAALAGAGRPSDALDLLLVVVMALLVVSVRNTWDLLVTVAESSPRDDT